MADFSYIRDEEIRSNINRFYDILISAKKNKEINITNFLNPKEIEYAKALLNKEVDIDYMISNVPINCEKSIIILWDNNIYDKSFIDQFDYLGLLQIKANSDLSHRDILGAVLNLGVAREKVGDIFFYNQDIYLVASLAIAKFLNLNLTKIKRENISTKLINENIEKDRQEFEVKTDIIQSTRLDLLVAKMAAVSRSDAKKLISSAKIKLNYETNTDPSSKIEENSLVSIRGYGRFIYSKNLGTTKKDKLRVEYKKYL